MTPGSIHPTAPDRADTGCGCDIDVCITASGDVHVYNCATPPDPGSPDSCEPDVVSCPPCLPAGACVPVVAGAKHKQSREQRLSGLAQSTSVPSALATSTLHAARRFLAGKTPGNALEAELFDRMSQLSPRLREVLSCAVAAYEHDACLSDPSLPHDPDEPIDPDRLATAWVAEIRQRVADIVFGDPDATEQERAGRIRVEPPPAEFFYHVVRICSVNLLRTANYEPPLLNYEPPLLNYEPHELEQQCDIVWNNGEPDLVCQIPSTDCPGNAALGACLRVPEVLAGDAVVLSGVNFFSVDATIRLVDKDGTIERVVDAHVVGDLETPVNEIVDGQTVLIDDCRVHDRLTFQVPEDLPPAIYTIEVRVPNLTGFPAFGDTLSSPVEFIAVTVPPTARFVIASEQLDAEQETSPARWGSDEVAFRALSMAVLPDMTLGALQTQKARHGNVDSGDERAMTLDLFAHDVPIAGASIMMLGHEVDSERAYRLEIEQMTDFFVDLVGRQIDWLRQHVSLDDLKKLSPNEWIALAIGAAILLGIDLLVAWWAPADPIMSDVVGIDLLELAALTSPSLPAPAQSTHAGTSGIVVTRLPGDKIPQQYSERRQHVSDEEDSRYVLHMRYTRLA